MKMAEAIQQHFPGKSGSPVSGDFTVVDDGTSEFLEYWNEAGMGAPRPTDEELAAWMAETS